MISEDIKKKLGHWLDLAESGEVILASYVVPSFYPVDLEEENFFRDWREAAQAFEETLSIEGEASILVAVLRPVEDAWVEVQNFRSSQAYEEALKNE